MRPLTKSEKRLLALCLLTIFVVGNLFLARTHLARYQADKQENVRLEGEIRANEVWVSDRKIWEEHKAWVDANLPEMTSAGQAGGALLEELQQAAFDNRFEIEKQSLQEPKARDNYQTVAASLSLEGDLVALSQWLSTLQRPDNFYRIRSLRLEQDRKSKKETPQAECQVTIERWFRL